MPTVEFQGDDGPALEYIRQRGYASYGSLKNVRDKIVPTVSDAQHFKFGKELHSRYLEGIVLEKLSASEERQLKDMIETLKANAVAASLLKGAEVEVEFRKKIYGFPMLGYIDIKKPNNLADLKTTRHSNMRAFVESMDFLQAAVYLKATGAENFFYLGICKQKPYHVMPFNVRQYPVRLKKAETELQQLLAYVKRKLS